MAEETKDKQPQPKVQKQSQLTVVEFSDSRPYSDSDKRVMKKMYGDAKKTEADWEKTLSKKFNLSK